MFRVLFGLSRRTAILCQSHKVLSHVTKGLAPLTERLSATQVQPLPLGLIRTYLQRGLGAKCSRKVRRLPTDFPIAASDVTGD